MDSTYAQNISKFRLISICKSPINSCRKRAFLIYPTVCAYHSYLVVSYIRITYICMDVNRYISYQKC
jgi:hypothetical protein